MLTGQRMQETKTETLFTTSFLYKCIHFKADVFLCKIQQKKINFMLQVYTFLDIIQYHLSTYLQ